jgi:hypothetical protein
MQISIAQTITSKTSLNITVATSGGLILQNSNTPLVVNIDPSRENPLTKSATTPITIEKSLQLTDLGFLIAGLLAFSGYVGAVIFVLRRRFL